MSFSICLPRIRFIECATSDNVDSDSFEQAEATPERQCFVANFLTVWTCNRTSNAEIEVNLVSNQRRIQQCCLLLLWSEVRLVRFAGIRAAIILNGRPHAARSSEIDRSPGGAFSRQPSAADLQRSA